MNFSRYYSGRIVGLITIVLVLLIAGVTAESELVSTEKQITDPVVEDVDAGEFAGTSWVDTNMTDVITGNRFNIRQLIAEGKPVIIHTFAVWCPGCTKQLLESTNKLSDNPDITIVGLDIDPNEDKNTLKYHVEKNKFKGYYANAPSDLTKALISLHGADVVLEIPQTIVVCPNGAHKLGSGIFDADTLQKATETLCL